VWEQGVFFYWHIPTCLYVFLGLVAIKGNQASPPQGHAKCEYHCQTMIIMLA